MIVVPAKAGIQVKDWVPHQVRNDRRINKPMFKKRLGEKLGEGTEKRVYINQENPEHVIGVFHEYVKETPQQIKGRFYLNKILHLLFPKQIPDIHLSTSSPHIIEVDRIKGMLFNEDDKKSESDRTMLLKRLDDLDVIIDFNKDNFKYDQENNLAYIDSTSPFFSGERHYDPKKIRFALEKLDKDDKERGLVFLKRLEELYQEELTSIQNEDNTNKEVEK